MSEHDAILGNCLVVPLDERLSRDGHWPVTADRPTVLQLNLGYRCNQTCAHCHIEAGPGRTETMSDDVISAAVGFAHAAGIAEVDLTGGAPELHPRFREIVSRFRETGTQVTDRCNLTVLREPGQADLPVFLAEHGVAVTASLPCYTPDTTDRVRGDRVFEKSISALRALNAVGYGIPGSGPELTLVYSPASATLPGRQESLESDYRARLREDHGIEFTRLIAMTNMPIGRFLRSLVDTRRLRPYMRALESSFNPATLPNLMCRTTISVAWNGTLYDCDFNQALGLAIRNGKVAHIAGASSDKLAGRAVRCLNHCYGCTAGSGSGCGGAVT